MAMLAITASAAVDWSNSETIDGMPLAELVEAVRQDLGASGDDYLAAAERSLERAETEEGGRLYAMACAGVLRTHYRRGQLPVAIDVAERCLAHPVAPNDDSGYFNLRNGLATLQLLSGKPQQALSTFEILLDDPPDSVDPVIVRRAQGNYAGALKHTGQPLQALSVLSDVLGAALENGDAYEQVGFGNNLVLLLEEIELYQDANDWLTRLAPAMAAVPESVPVQSLRLHEIQLHGLLHDQAEAIAGFERFIAETGPAANDVLVGSAHEFLADAFYDVGDYAASTAAALRAVELLRDAPIEIVDAQLTLARAALAQEDFEQAEAALRFVRDNPSKGDVTLGTLAMLELELALARSNEPVLLERLRSLLDERDALERDKRRQFTSYFDAKLEAAAKAAQLEHLERRQVLLEAEAAASAAREQSARRVRNVTIISVVFGALMLSLIGYLWSRRRFDAAIQAQQREHMGRLESEVRIQSAALAKRAHSEALGKLTGNVAHDFNNLLQIVSLANERFSAEPVSDLAARLLKGSNEALSSASGIVRRLLAYARQQELHAQPIALAPFIDDCKALFEAAVGRGIALTVRDSTDETIGVLVDPAQLTSALINLLKNAADAVGGQGQVAVEFSEVEIDRELSGRVWQLDSGQYIQVLVTDDGCGMSEEQVQRATEPFFSTQSETSGTGLGLSSVYGFVRQSGGDLVIDSTPSVGTRIALRFPAVVLSEAASKPVVIDQPELDGARALLVEDNKTLADALVIKLQGLGVSTHWVASGDQAIEHLGSDTPDYDFVLSDVRMPGDYDGFALADWMSNHLPEIPVLLMSGYSESAGTARQLLAKPFSDHELRAALADLIVTHRQ